MTTPLLEVDGLTVQYETNDGPVTAVSNASFSINAAEYFGLVGESGCGKSTIAKTLVGALDSNGLVPSGSIRFKGRELQAMSEDELNEEVRWNEISFIPQSSMNNLDPIMRISEQAQKIAKAHSDMDREEVRTRFGDLFETVGLNRDRIDDYPHQFSGGMKQRAVIALSFLLDPSLIIADEPTTALDVIMQDQIFHHLDKMKAQSNTSLLMITHDISLVFESCDSMAVMHGGQIAERGDVFELFDNPKHPYSLLLQRAFPSIQDPKRELETIDGYPPKTIGEIDFCTFVDRCPWATEDCAAVAPPMKLIENTDDHAAACIRNDEIEELSSKGEVVKND